jgi:alanine dehydrogenase
MKPDEIIFLAPQDVRKLLTLEECIVAVEESFRLYGEGKAQAPGVLSMHGEGGGFHVKAGMLHLKRPYFAAKINGNFPGNFNNFGLPTIQGVIVLSDAENGTPLAIMDSRDVTSLRTAAATAVAAKYLSRTDSRTVTICGCGEQGRLQLQALACVRQLQTVFAYDQRPEQTKAYAAELTSELKIPVTAVTDLATFARRSDICVTCTPSQRPLLGLNDVQPGTFIAAIGADNPFKQEIHPTLLAQCKLVCDVLEQCAVIGDLHHALEAGIVGRSDVHAELGEVVAGKKPGRESGEEITIFDSTGMALQDVAAAAMLYEKAKQQNAGVRLNFAA